LEGNKFQKWFFLIGLLYTISGYNNSLFTQDVNFTSQ
jgi:hypothetical protein